MLCAVVYYIITPLVIHLMFSFCAVDHAQAGAILQSSITMTVRVPSMEGLTAKATELWNSAASGYFVSYVQQFAHILDSTQHCILQHLDCLLPWGGNLWHITDQRVAYSNSELNFLSSMHFT